MNDWLRECSNEDLLAEVVRRCRVVEHDELCLDPGTLTDAVGEYLDPSSRWVLEKATDGPWAYEELLGPDGVEDFRRQVMREVAPLAEIVQALARPARPDDYLHALDQAERWLIENCVYGPWPTQVGML